MLPLPRRLLCYYCSNTICYLYRDAYSVITAAIPYVTFTEMHTLLLLQQYHMLPLPRRILCYYCSNTICYLYRHVYSCAPLSSCLQDSKSWRTVFSLTFGSPQTNASSWQEMEENGSNMYAVKHSTQCSAQMQHTGAVQCTQVQQVVVYNRMTASKHYSNDKETPITHTLTLHTYTHNIHPISLNQHVQTFNPHTS